MDDSSPVGTGGAGRSDETKSRQLALGIVLAILAVSYGGTQIIDKYRDDAVKKSASDYVAFMANVSKADAITDPLQRCLNYPDLPGSHWNAQTTRAYCVLRNQKTVSLSQIDALLTQGKADEVDRIFQGYLDTQRKDPKQPGLFDIAFINAGFEDASADARRVIDTWKQQSPNSAFAFAASGVQYVDAAQQARGDGWSYQLTDKQTDGMNQQVELAKKDLNRAVELNPSVTVAYPSMMYAGALVSDDGYLQESAELALKADASNFAIRGQMMNLAQSKWGSHFDGVDAQSSEDLALAQRNPLLRLVAQDPLVDQATCDCNMTKNQTERLVEQAADKNVNTTNLQDLASQVYDSNKPLAVELYSELLRFKPTNADVLRWRSQEMIALGDRKGAVSSFANVSRLYPDNNDLTAELGNIYAQAGDVKQAENTLLSVLQRDPNNLNALGSLGDLYNHAGHQPQKAAALADTIISKYPDKANGYIVRACNQMDHNLPGVYDTLHYFIDHFGDDPQWKTQTAEMRAYLAKHPEKVSS
jgi:tetratricopeptide (TPR) repeat protein